MDLTVFMQRLEIVKARAHDVAEVFREIYRGFYRKDEMLYRFLCASVAIGLAVILEWDVWTFKRFGAWQLYPRDGFIFKVYVLILMFLPLLFFGIVVRERKRRFAGGLKETFDLVGLKNAIGAYPRFLSLEPLSGGTMKLRLTNGAFPPVEWLKRKERLEAHMRVFIDEIRSIQERGIIEMTFSYDPMPTKVSIENILGFRDYKFLLGRDRTKAFMGDFSMSPHLLVGGETGKGKSAFLRQLITTIKVNQPEAEFHIVDLKGGVDFGYMEKFPLIKVIQEVEGVAAALKTLVAQLAERTAALKKRNLTKIDDFFTTDEFRRMNVAERSRHVLGRRVFVVIDECAEIFLFGLGHDPKVTREIRATMSQITRLGRFVGIHVILGTQRPDKHAIDPQVKTNLTSTVCYRIHDHGGSLAVLGTGRATDLPQIAGRAILAEGADEVEIQTPFLEFRDSLKLLEEKFPTTQNPESALGESSDSQEKSSAEEAAPQSDTLKD